MARQVPLTEVSKLLETTVAGLDRTRAADLQELSEIRAVKFAGLARYRDLLIAKLDAKHPRVLALDRMLALHQETIPGFRAEIALSSRTPPKVDARSWVLHGTVRDADRTPVPGLTVALYQKDTWIQQLGYACTEADGYFVLLVEDAAKAPAEPVSIRLLRSGKVVHVEPAPVSIQASRVEYREIALGKEPAVCPPPATGREPAPPPCDDRPKPPPAGKTPKREASRRP